MIELTREDLIIWLSNPITKGFYKALKKSRDEAENAAFNATLDNYKTNGLVARNTDELFAYRNLEVLNGLVLSTFYPLYEDLKKEESETKNPESEEKEEEKKDSIQQFLNNLKEVSKNEK